VTRVRAANRFAAAESRSSARSSAEWHEEQEQEQEQEQDNLGHNNVVPGSFEPVHQQPSLAWKKNLDVF